MWLQEREKNAEFKQPQRFYSKMFFFCFISFLSVSLIGTYTHINYKDDVVVVVFAPSNIFHFVSVVKTVKQKISDSKYSSPRNAVCKQNLNTDISEKKEKEMMNVWVYNLIIYGFNIDTNTLAHKMCCAQCSYKTRQDTEKKMRQTNICVPLKMLSFTKTNNNNSNE